MAFYRMVIMGRKLREIYNGALYHVIQRGNNHNYIYEDISDKRKFFDLLNKSRMICDFQVLYYVLLDNHYHLVLESSDIPIWKGIQKLNQTYSKYYNRKYNRSGGIYGGRYTSYIIKDSEYFYQAIRYIAQNPVKADIVKSPSDYLWSAHQAVCAEDNEIVNIERTLSFFPGTKRTAKQSYLALIENNDKRSASYASMPFRENRKIGDALDYILKASGYSETLCSRLKNGDKRSDIKSERDAFIKTAYKAGIAPKDIAKYLSFSPEGVRKILRG